MPHDTTGQRAWELQRMLHRLLFSERPVRVRVGRRGQPERRQERERSAGYVSWRIRNGQLSEDRIKGMKVRHLHLKRCLQSTTLLFHERFEKRKRIQFPVLLWLGIGVEPNEFE